MATSIEDWRKQKFLQWLCTIKEDRDPPLQKDLADQLGVSHSTLIKWKDDPEFLSAWEHKYRRTVGSPERMQLVLERLFETATDRTDPRQVPAAREYRIAVEGVAPTRIELDVTAAKNLSDEELAHYIAAGAQSELERRG
jgi:transcriptional regulator with XRE-family HTH domain